MNNCKNKVKIQKNYKNDEKNNNKNGKVVVENLGRNDRERDGNGEKENPKKNHKNGKNKNEPGRIESKQKIKTGKKKKEQIKIGTWNIRTMLETGKMEQITLELEKYGIDLGALQEIRWKGQGTVDGAQCTVYYSGNEKQGQYGVAFMVMKKLKHLVLDFKPINERLAYMRIEMKPFNLSLLNVYAPTETAEEEVKNGFYEKLETEYEKIPKEDTIIVLGDFNARIGKEDHLRQIAGKETIHEKSNDNGERLWNMAMRTNLIIGSTIYKHPSRHKVTWMAPDRKTYTQIDHVLISKRKRTDLTDVRTYRGANADTDHFLVVAKIRQKIKRNIKRIPKKWDLKKFESHNKKVEYAALMNELLSHQNDKAQNIQQDWQQIKDTVNNVANEIIGTIKGVNKQWFNEECQEMVSAKANARIKWLNSNRQEDKQKYLELRKKAKKVTRATQRAWIEREIEEIEREYYNRNTKQFYKKISEQNKSYKGKTTGLKNKQGKIAESEEEYKEIWKQYFKELLYEEESEEVPQDEDEEERNESENNDEAPTREEVKEVINKSRNGKAPGEDRINIEFIKYGGELLQERIYQLIKNIWTEEKMPREWETGEIVTIHKKGDQQICSNYRGLTMLNTAYKILSSIIQSRLTKETGQILGQYQCGFTKGRSTTDAIHTLKRTLEKTHEYKMKIELIFIDFKQAFDSLRRNQLMKALQKLGIPGKLRRLIQMTMTNTRMRVKTTKGVTEEFEINKGVRQGDSLSTTLFNLALDYVVKKINKGTLRTREGQIIAYADDIVIISKNRKTTEEMVAEIIREGEKMGLKINTEKTKMMRLDRKLDPKNNKIKIGTHIFEEVDRFKYLGAMITNDGDGEAEIKERIMNTNRVYQANKKLLTSKTLGKKTKMKIYRTIIQPTMMYAAETMTMTQKQEEQLRIQERKIIRTILGPIKTEDNEYRIRTNKEILEELNGEDIVRKIKKQRIRWLGHVWRAGNKAMIYSVVEWQPGGTRRRGRPRSTWIKEVNADLARTGIRNWQQKTKDRRQWKAICNRI